VAFLEAHFPSVSREGLRYAIEKMPRTLQESLLSRHKVAPRAPRRSR